MLSSGTPGHRVIMSLETEIIVVGISVPLLLLSVMSIRTWLLSDRAAEVPRPRDPDRSSNVSRLDC